VRNIVQQNTKVTLNTSPAFSWLLNDEDI